MPVYRNGKPFRLLAVVMDARGFLRLLSEREIPRGWLAGIIDSQGRFLARIPDHERSVGQLASAGWRAHQHEEGVFQFKALDGDAVVHANAASRISGWTAGIAMRKAILDAPILDTVKWAALIAIAVTGLSLALSVWVAMGISRPIELLQQQARTLVSGKAARLQEDLPEVDRVWQTLQQAVGERAAAEKRQALLVNELNHRVKNMLAVVQSLASQTLRATPDPSEFATAFSARLSALAGAHSLLTAAAWEGAALDRVVETALSAFKDSAAIRLAGPPAMLPSNFVVSLSLMVHELATNASKYGALSTPGGELIVEWKTEPINGGNEVELHWTERRGPPVAQPSRKGFGMHLLELSAEQMHGSIDLDFRGEGLVCTIKFPVKKGNDI
jgi:two-component sensor histidine kinase